MGGSQQHHHERSHTGLLTILALVCLASMGACETPISSPTPTSSERPNLALVYQAIQDRVVALGDPRASGFSSLEIDEVRGKVVLTVIGPDAPLLDLLPDYGDVLVIEYGPIHVPRST